MTHLVYDTGTITVGPGPLTQIGPNLDVSKYSKIRVLADEVAPPAGPILVDLQVVEGNVTLPLAIGLAFPLPLPHTAVFEVPGRELQIFVREAPPGKRLRLFVFGLES
jgi:hypothetical protein